MEKETLSRLRASLDGRDSFVSGGHGVISTAGATRHASRMTKIPVWALNDAKIKELIEKRFPKAQTDLKQREQATRMVRIIYLYYRVGMTAAQVAIDVKMTENALWCLLRRLNRQMEKPLKSSHRPKREKRPRKGDRIGATNEDSGDSAAINL